MSFDKEVELTLKNLSTNEMLLMVVFSGCFLITQVLYKENMGKGTPLPVTPEMERVKHNQENISSVLWRETKQNKTKNYFFNDLIYINPTF